MHLRSHPLDGALLYFDRMSGLNVRLEGPTFRGLERRAPRVVHVGITNRCNLRCSFCFRDRALDSTWTAEEILAWAKALADEGVLEIAFGQGEPLALRGFPALVRALHHKTPLSVCFTTNGLLLTQAALDELNDAYGQIRLSFYDDNDPFARAAMLARRGARFGANLLVTPASLPSIRDTLDRLVDVGAGDVLLLSYNGPDPRLHLGFEDDRSLARALLKARERYGERLTLKLSVCFGDRLPEVPRIVAPSDCGAGDEFLAIDSEKRLLACSFHAEAAPVRSAAEALRCWRMRRRARSHARIRGCARPDGRLPVAVEPPAPVDDRAIVWRGWASNHSTSYTLVGELPSAAKAAAFVADVQQLLARCEAAEKGGRGATPASTVWELLGKKGEPPHHAWTTTASTLFTWRPPVILAGGKRVVIDDSSTLGDVRVFAHLLLARYGRLLWHDNDYKTSPSVVFGVDAGRRAGEIEGKLGRALTDMAVAGPRLYGVIGRDEARALATILRDLPWSIGVRRETRGAREALAEVIADPVLMPARKRRVEWLVLERCDPARWKRMLADLSGDTAAALARAGWTRPFRWPSHLTARRVLGGMVVRTEGPPVPAALQHYLLDQGVDWLSVVEREDIRIRIELDRGSESDDAPARAAWEQRVARISKPGWVVDIRPYSSTIDILPREPLAALSQASTMVKGEGRKSIAVLPARPLADAIARIQDDLDGAR